MKKQHIQVQHTNKMGVSLAILARTFRTISPSPVMHTFVTSPCGRRCNDGTDFGSEVVTAASILPALVSVI